MKIKWEGPRMLLLFNPDCGPLHALPTHAQRMPVFT